MCYEVMSQSLTALSAQVVHILGDAQKSDNCPPNIREALDRAMVSEVVIGCDWL